MKNLFTKNGLSLIIAISLLMCGCDIVSREEITRIKSTDSMVEAILVRANAGATTSYVYSLYIVPTGEKKIKGNELFRADKVEGLDISWKENRYLEIKFKKGRIFYFKNFWLSEDVQNFRYVVELRLAPLETYSLDGAR